jgi:hypothetical protein
LRLLWVAAREVLLYGVHPSIPGIREEQSCASKDDVPNTFLCTIRYNDEGEWTLERSCLLSRPIGKDHTKTWPVWDHIHDNLEQDWRCHAQGDPDNLPTPSLLLPPAAENEHPLSFFDGAAVTANHFSVTESGLSVRLMRRELRPDGSISEYPSNFTADYHGPSGISW